MSPYEERRWAELQRHWAKKAARRHVLPSEAVHLLDLVTDWATELMDPPRRGGRHQRLRTRDVVHQARLYAQTLHLAEKYRCPLPENFQPAAGTGPTAGTVRDPLFSPATTARHHPGPAPVRTGLAAPVTRLGRPQPA